MSGLDGTIRIVYGMVLFGLGRNIGVMFNELPYILFIMGIGSILPFSPLFSFFFFFFFSFFSVVVDKTRVQKNALTQNKRKKAEVAKEKKKKKKTKKRRNEEEKEEEEKEEKKRKENRKKRMLLVPRSELTIRVYNSTAGIGTAKEEESNTNWPLWVGVGVGAFILLALIVFLVLRKGGTKVTQSSPGVPTAFLP